MQVKDLFLGLGESLVGKTCGFLGLGKIGMATARRQKNEQMSPKMSQKQKQIGLTDTSFLTSHRAFPIALAFLPSIQKDWP